jgi:flagellar secretion chaperone FliS
VNPYANTYRKQQVQTASREQILIMLYEGAIRFLTVAKAGLAENNLEKFNNNIIKTQRIITEFMTTLDMEIGGEMAQNLFKLYAYLHYRLVQANFKKDVSMIDEVQTHLRELKETWQTAIDMTAKEKTQAQKDSSESNVYIA